MSVPISYDGCLWLPLHLKINRLRCTQSLSQLHPATASFKRVLSDDQSPKFGRNYDVSRFTMNPVSEVCINRVTMYPVFSCCKTRYWSCGKSEIVTTCMFCNQIYSQYLCLWLYKKRMYMGIYVP